MSRHIWQERLARKRMYSSRASTHYQASMRKGLKNDEKAWRSRYAKLMAAHARAKLDVGAKKEVRAALGRSLPDAICWSIVAYVQ